MIVLSCLAARGEPDSEPKVGAVLAHGLRRFELDFGEMVDVLGARFTLRSKSGEEMTAEFDRSQKFDEKIAVFIPRYLQGLVELSWTVPRVAGERLQGVINLNLE